MSAASPAKAQGVITDAFGTRLDPDELLAGLDALGLDGGALRFTDAGVTLRCTDEDPRSDAVARASTWLRTRLSPLVPVHVEVGSAASERFVDARTRVAQVVSVVELVDPPAEMALGVAALCERLGAATGVEGGGRPSCPSGLGGPLPQFMDALADALASAGVAATLAGYTARGGWVQGDADGELHVVLWLRPPSPEGVRQAALLAASRDRAALQWFAQAAHVEAPSGPVPDVLIDGLAWSVARRPTVASLHRAKADAPVRVDPERCDGCGVCERLCPVDFLDGVGQPRAGLEPDACIRCQVCVEACPTDAMRPVYGPETATLASTLAHRPGWLARLSGAAGPSTPAPFPPSYLLPKAPAEGGPRYVLGLAVMTMQEHAAVLLRDGELVGAIELERLNRRRHAGWHPPGRPGVTAAVDPTICVEQTFCFAPIRALLDAEGITLDDLECIAVNGLHGRLRHAFSFIDDEEAIPALRVGRVLYLPHHLTHAASAFRLSGQDSGWVMTLDGRGDRECGAVFRAEGGEIRALRTVLALDDRSIGGVYEGVTRVLGFGGHGQGSTMALAAFGEPRVDMSAFLSAEPVFTVHEQGINEAFAELRREHPDDAHGPEHHDLAASLQRALEDVAGSLLESEAGAGPLDGLSLAGGVSLNCRMNNGLRLRFRPASIFAQPGANDGGTAMGAALEAWHRLGGAPLPALEHALLGPSFDDEAILDALRGSGLRFAKVEDVSEAVAERVAGGEVLCWFQGAMEFGPRALGARSIVADPRRPAIKDRVNAIKQRQPWRPFGPSILAGREGEWFEEAFDSRFMLFTVGVLEGKRAEVPAVVHVDGSTRPQVVHAHTHPRYHAMIAAFERRTGVPMVINTSFNRRGEPIVCTPEDALDSFLGLGADALAIGSFIVEHPSKVAPPSFQDCLRDNLPDFAGLAMLPGKADAGRLRVVPSRPLKVLTQLARGRERGHARVVVDTRGLEPGPHADLPELVRHARTMGYAEVALRVDVVALRGAAAAIERARLDVLEVQVWAPGEALHDRLSGAPGSYRPSLAALRSLARAKSGPAVTLDVPVLRSTQRLLGGVVKLAGALGVQSLRLAMAEPGSVAPAELPRVAEAAAYVRQVAPLAARAGLELTVEALPECLLADTAGRRERPLRVASSATAAEPAPCRACRAQSTCAKTWPSYLERFGTAELRPLPPE